MHDSSILSNPVNRDTNQYLECGYCLPGRSIDADSLRTAQRNLDTLIGYLKPNQRSEGLIEPHELTPEWRDWLELCRHPEIVKSARECLQCDELVLLMSHLIVKPAGDGKMVAWHQDNTYWPQVHGTDITTVWLAIDDADLENSCLQVIPGSHADHPELQAEKTDGEDLLGVKLDVSPELEAQAIPFVLKAGEFSLHDSYLIHGSTANTSDRRRAGYTIRFGNAATVRVDPERKNRCFYVAGDGTNLRDNYIDLRPGCPQPAEGGPELRGWGFGPSAK